MDWSYHILIEEARALKLAQQNAHVPSPTGLHKYIATHEWKEGELVEWSSRLHGLANVMLKPDRRAQKYCSSHEHLLAFLWTFKCDWERDTATGVDSAQAMCPSHIPWSGVDSVGASELKSMWSKKLSLLSMMTPRSRMLLNNESWIPPNVKMNRKQLCFNAKSRWEHLAGFSVLCHVQDHECSQFKSFWSSSPSCASVIVLNTLRSSACIRQFESKSSGMSLINAKNRLGPSIKASRAPLLMGHHLEFAPLMTRCHLWLRYKQ